MAVIFDTREIEEEYEWEDIEWDIKNICENLDTNNEYLFVKGQVGRWNGVSSGCIYSKDAYETYRHTMVDCDDIKFEEEAEGLLHMTGWHHDGTAECWWYTVNDVKKFEEKYFIDYEGDIAKYDENDEADYNFDKSELDEFLIPANWK